MNGAQYKDSKIITNKTGDTLAGLSQLKNYDPPFFNLKRRKERKNLQLHNRNKKTFIILLSMDELTSTIQATKNSAPGPDGIPNAMVKHPPPEGMDTVLNLYNEICNKVFSVNNE